jgi:hypothetical protein
MIEETYNGGEYEYNDIWHPGRGSYYYYYYDGYLYSGSAPGSHIPGGSAPSTPSAYGSTIIVAAPLNYTGNPNFNNFAFVDPEAILNEKCPKPPEPSIPEPATPPETPAPPAKSSSWLDRFQTVLDVAGFLPVIGSVADIINGGIHLARGNYVEAGFSVIAVVPAYGDAVAGARKVAKAADKVGDIIKTGNQADEAIDITKKIVNNNTATNEAAIIGKDTQYSRPSDFRKGVRDQVYDDATEESTKVARDPVTGKFIGRDSNWDMGHKPGYEFKKHQQSAKERGISRSEFLDEHNEPSHYRPELRSSNRGHKGEAPDNIDLW